MRTKLSFLLFFFSVGLAQAQQWVSINKQGTYELSANEQFIINPYTNAIWIVHGLQVAVIEPDGNIRVFNQTTGEISHLQEWNDLHFAFTPNHTYYANPATGLYTFDNYSEQLVYDLTSTNGFLSKMTVNESSVVDTVYMGFDPDPFNLFWGHLIYSSSTGVVSSEQVFDVIFAKGNQKYLMRQSGFYLAYSDGITMFDTIHWLVHPSNGDIDYLGGGVNDAKFQRNGDTLFIAGDSGISIIYDYDLLPENFTQSNTVNMPSNNVLEIEFDESDSLWAVFGDQNNDPFAIAKLNGTYWEHLINESNSPITFGWGTSLEFDSLGNIWVHDGVGVHTLKTNTSPEWLNTIDINVSRFSIYPNPTSGTVHIHLNDGMQVDQIELLDLSGRTVFQAPFASQFEASLSSGTYLLNLYQGQDRVGTERVVVK